MSVIQDHNRHCGIVIAQGPKFVTAVMMDSGELTTTRISQDEYEERAFRVLDYPLQRAADHFLNHPGGISEAARRAIEKITMADMLS